MVEIKGIKPTDEVCSLVAIVHMNDFITFLYWEVAHKRQSRFKISIDECK